jgi:ATP-dependent helicase HepA
MYNDPALAEVVEALEEWRTLADLHATSGNDAQQAALLAGCFRLFAEAISSGGGVLAEMAAIRLRGTADTALLALFPAESRALRQAARFPGEEHALQRLCDLDLAHDDSPRLQALHAFLTENLDSHFAVKVVVFANFPLAADTIQASLTPRWGPASVRHGMPQWQRFRTDPTCRILVCDRRAEEGLNLQGPRMSLVHYDLPLSPNRIEQRIG